MQPSISMNSFSARPSVERSTSTDVMLPTPGTEYYLPIPDHLTSKSKSTPSELISTVGMRFSCLIAWGWLRYFCLLGAHLFFSCLSRLLPHFDLSGDFTSAPLRGTSHIASVVIPVHVVLAYIAFVIPFIARYSECVASGNYAPANEFRRRWTPSFWTAATKQVVAHVWAVCLCVGSCYFVRAMDSSSSRLIDPAHAFMVGFVARVMFVVAREMIVDRTARAWNDEDDVDGYWVYY